MCSFTLNHVLTLLVQTGTVATSKWLRNYEAVLPTPAVPPIAEITTVPGIGAVPQQARRQGQLAGAAGEVRHRRGTARASTPATSLSAWKTASASPPAVVNPAQISPASRTGTPAAAAPRSWPQ